MKNISLIGMLFITSNIFAQQNKYLGIWEGKIEAGVNLRIGFNFTTDSSGKFFASMDSPDQGALGLATDTAYLRNDSVFTEIKKYKVFFAGALVSDTTINGEFNQGGKIPLKLTKVKSLSKNVKPQTPLPPFPYNAVDVTFPGGAKGVTLSGTITYPITDPQINYIKAPVFPSIILLTGSGPQNRDEEIMGHKPFAVLADYLTKKGFIVLRYDDRGTAKSTGDFNNATSADFADDVNAAVNFLKKQQGVNTSKIGLLGHSEGGLLAPMVAAKRKDIGFLVLLAAPGIKIIDMMAEQNVAVLSSMGMSKKTTASYAPLYKRISLAIVNAPDTTVAIRNAKQILKSWLKANDAATAKDLGFTSPASQNKYVNDMVAGFQGKWFHYFLNYDPATALQKVNARVLALNGDKDIQVISKPNLAGIKAALVKTKSQVTIEEISGVNHLFQNCKTCTVAEYSMLSETISPAVLTSIGNWLTKNIFSN